MTLVSYVTVVAIGIGLISLGWIIADLQIRVKALERRMEDE